MSVNEKMTAIANAIRSKTGTTDAMTLDEMATEITGISMGGSDGWEAVLISIIDRSASDIALPAGLTSIGAYAFNNCKNLALTSLPAGLTSINSYAFRECAGLTSITFEGTPTSISSTAFYNCTNLATINVPWAEGAVSGAPWGATNATINYNYTEAA